ncbi:peptide/nickel transport system ATP-binding protein [Sinosporangium album]|uniref:Peptide/nickel transport system ATP-binding protein n=1 Tax=Sinosporangium album TaxID=504805 RepID=A0A1G7QWN9_9ACTN|nr:ATP-binding cassette domain-containing protein [Sinosporangium album]SDG02946.1 peptide/nickel transport system ATP-binding protein [Sinosporangium album]
MLEARDITVRYGSRTVLDRVSLTVEPGAVLGLGGPSGCGKSTLARVMAMMLRPRSGSVAVDGRPVSRWRQRAPRELRTRVALIYQQPRLAVDPRLTLREIVAEPLAAAGTAAAGTAAAGTGTAGTGTAGTGTAGTGTAGTGTAGTADAERVAALAAEVGLTGDLLTRRPHEVSDGQLQRACVARALILSPGYLICDEMTTMLDASTQAHLVRVVNAYRERTGAGVLAISHDAVLLGRWADGVAELGQGGKAAVSV